MQDSAQNWEGTPKSIHSNIKETDNHVNNIAIDNIIVFKNIVYPLLWLLLLLCIIII